MRRIRRIGLATAVGAIMTTAHGGATGAAADAWPRATPVEAGFAADLGERIDARVADGSFGNLHAVVVARHGRLVLERYYAGEDEMWGRPLGRVAFGPETPHDLRSISKSVVGLLYGIALADGSVPPLDAPLLAQFPEYPELAQDPVRRRMTVRHALTMNLGTEWDEGLSYADPRNSEHAMELADDRYRYVLERPMAAAPGSRWAYNGGATAVLARLIAKGTGLALGDYAAKRLFRPLGIQDATWLKGGDGEHLAASGLRLRPRDLARIGQLVLNRGRWGEVQVVPADWLERSFQVAAKVDDQVNYGLHWWLGPTGADGRPWWIAGFGNGGQRLFVGPRTGLVVVVNAGNYNQPDAWKLPVAVIVDIVLPALERR